MPEENSVKPVVEFRVIRIDEVCNRLQLSKSWIYQQVSLDKFPRPISLGARAVGWIESEVEGWLEERIADSRSNNGTGLDG